MSVMLIYERAGHCFQSEYKEEVNEELLSKYEKNII